jgi:hypothetical protein
MVLGMTGVQMECHWEWAELSITALAMWLWKYIHLACENLATNLIIDHRPCQLVTGSFARYRLTQDEIQELRLWLKTRAFTRICG